MGFLEPGGIQQRNHPESCVSKPFQGSQSWLCVSLVASLLHGRISNLLTRLGRKVQSLVAGFVITFVKAKTT